MLRLAQQHAGAVNIPPLHARPRNEMQARFKRRRTTALIALLCWGVAAHGAGREAWTQVRSEAIRSHVEFLASDLLEGRAAASRGYDIAASYVAAQFRQCGLTPAGSDSFYQTVPLLEATAVLPGSAAELAVDGDAHSFEYSTDYLPSADFMSASSTLSAPMTFAGYGIAAPELGHDDFANLDLQGRIAVIFSGAPASFPQRSARVFFFEHDEVRKSD